MARTKKEQLEKRLSKAVVVRIYDDNNDGTADNDPIEEILLDSEAKVNSYLAPVGLIPDPMPDPPPREITRLDLDVATAYAAQRFPETVRLDWEKLMKQAEADLDKLRLGKTALGAKPPDPAANHGGAVYRDDREPVTGTEGGGGRTFEKMGDF